MSKKHTNNVRMENEQTNPMVVKAKNIRIRLKAID